MTRFPRARFFFLAPALVACMAQAQAPEWKEICKTPRTTVEVRVGSVIPTKRGVTAWLRIRPVNPPMTVPGFSDQVFVIVEKAEFSKTRKWSHRFLLYDKDDRQLVDHSDPASSPGGEIIPDTVDDVCCQKVWALAPKGKKSTTSKTAR
ncbi:MAG: hypothetical protein WAS25_06290 [Geothrix sp.]|uniref:hypothetical protein n=1 Tax=Geothrix sp. TaxID=1962974 RepID=UPI003BAE3940